MRQFHVHATKRGTVCDQDGGTAAIVSGGVDGAPGDLAVLFAAAPDMLAALQMIDLDNAQTRMCLGYDAEEAIRAAIAKAEGRPT